MKFETLILETKNLSVLLVEDYEPLRNDMVEILEIFFETVAVAVDGHKALELYEEYHRSNKSFNLVISDIQMPGMDGVELSENLRTINAEQSIIILSAHTDSNYLLRLINLGISKFLTKPIEHDELLNTLYDECRKINTIDKNVKNISLMDLGEDYIWDKEKSVLKQNNKIVDLTRHELILIQFMVNRIEQICTNEDIMQNFYANNIDIGEKNIRNLFFKLRKKLPEKLITSIYGLGYKLIPIR